MESTYEKLNRYFGVKKKKKTLTNISSGKMLQKELSDIVPLKNDRLRQKSLMDP